PAHLKNARVGSLGHLLGKLQLILPGAVRPPKRGKLIDAAQRRMIVGGDELCPHAPDVDRCPLMLEALDNVFVEIVAANDYRFLEARLIQDLPRLNAEERQVAGVESDAGQFVPRPAQFPSDLDGMTHALQ